MSKFCDFRFRTHFNWKAPDGSKIQIIKRVAPRWYDLGTLLDFDDSGTELDIIKAEYRSEPVPCCRAMFHYWLNGNGRGPHSW